MHILYTGPISLDILSANLPLGVKFDDKEFRFDLGAHEVLGFLRAGHQVTVLKLTDLVTEPQIYTATNFELRLFPDRPVREQYRHFYHHEVKVLSAAIKAVDPDVVFANWPYQFARAALVSGYPTLVVAHDSPWRILWLMRDKARLLRAFYSQFLVMFQTKYMSAVSPYIVNDLRKFNAYTRKVRCVPNAVLKPIPQSCSKVIVQKATTIFSITEWSRRKNPKILLQAFSALNEKHPDWRLIVCGRGMGPGEAAERFMRKNGLSLRCVAFRGYQTREQLDQALRDEADIFCSPTLEESFGLIFIEAMLQGVPCVGGEKSGAVPWVIGEGGITCDITSLTSLEGTLERIMGDYELRKRLSENGFCRVKEEFALDKCVDGYLEALTCVAHGGTGW